MVLYQDITLESNKKLTSHIKMYEMSSYLNSSLMMIMMILLLMNPGNVSAIGCPFKLSCTHDNNKLIELPADPVPIKLLVSYIITLHL